MLGVADAWGPGGSGSRWGRWARGREWCAGAGLLGRSFGRASWAGLRAMQGWFAGRAGRAGCEAFFFSFLFLFYFSSLFEFKFDLEFEFKSGVPYSLDF